MGDWLGKAWWWLEGRRQDPSHLRNCSTHLRDESATPGGVRRGVCAANPTPPRCMAALQGFIPRATELVKLGGTFFLAFLPFILVVSVPQQTQRCCAHNRPSKSSRSAANPPCRCCGASHTPRCHPCLSPLHTRYPHEHRCPLALAPCMLSSATALCTAGGPPVDRLCTTMLMRFWPSPRQTPWCALGVCRVTRSCVCTRRLCNLQGVNPTQPAGHWCWHTVPRTRCGCSSTLCATVTLAPAAHAPPFRRCPSTCDERQLMAGSAT